MPVCFAKEMEIRIDHANLMKNNGVICTMRERDIQLYIGGVNTTIIEAMQIINKNTKGLLFITDEQKKLLGCVSDGDIRRWLIKTGNLDAKVELFMVKEPIVIMKSDIGTEKDVMRKHDVHVIPVVDNKYILIDIIVDKEDARINNSELRDVSLVIMAGGKGTRLSPYSHILPKPLIPIGEKTITEHIIDRFKNFGCNKVDMIVNYKKSLIETYFEDDTIPYDIGFIKEERFCGTGGGLKLLEGKYKDTFFLSNCDVLIDEDYSDILKFHRDRKNIITLVCAVKNVIIPYGTIELSGEGKPISLTEKPEYSFMTNTGLYVLEPSFLSKIPSDTFIHITDIIQKCIDEGENVGIYPIAEDNWMDMGQLEELEKMKHKLSVE